MSKNSRQVGGRRVAGPGDDKGRRGHSPPEQRARRIARLRHALRLGMLVQMAEPDGGGLYPAVFVGWLGTGFDTLWCVPCQGRDVQRLDLAGGRLMNQVYVAALGGVTPARDMPAPSRLWNPASREIARATGGTRSCGLEGCTGRKFGYRWERGNRLEWICLKRIIRTECPSVGILDT